MMRGHEQSGGGRCSMLRPLFAHTTLLCVLAALAVAAAPDDSSDLRLKGTKHDFTRLGVDESKKCSACHVPNTGDAGSGPLWDAATDSGKRYKLYGGRVGAPGSASLLCLSCHDGSSAIDAFGGLEGGSTMADIGGPRLVIGEDHDLSGDHPVGVDYPSWNRDYRSRAALEQAGYVQLPDGRVECSSCHDPHGQSGVDKLLVKSNVRSALCLTCHRK